MAWETLSLNVHPFKVCLFRANNTYVCVFVQHMMQIFVSLHFIEHMSKFIYHDNVCYSGQPCLSRHVRM